MTALAELIRDWRVYLLVLLVFGLAPGVILRIFLLAYPKRHPRRAELIGELYCVPLVERPIWVVQQVETALFEGPPSRWRDWRTARLARTGDSGRTTTRFLVRLGGAPSYRLAKTAHETARYAGLGWMILGSAVFSAFGMATLLSTISSLPMPVRLAMASTWGFFILGLDFVLVGFIDTPSAVVKAKCAQAGEAYERPARFATCGRVAIRILFAVIVGLAVGEGLVLSVFHKETSAVLTRTSELHLETSICLVDIRLSQFRPEVQPAANCAVLVPSEFGTANTATGNRSAGNSGASTSSVPAAALPERDSAQVLQDVALRSQLENALVSVRFGRGTYSLSARFDAVEQTVNPWMRWGLRLLFVFISVAPVLSKTTAGTSRTEMLFALEVANVLFGPVP